MLATEYFESTHNICINGTVRFCLHDHCHRIHCSWPVLQTQERLHKMTSKLQKAPFRDAARQWHINTAQSQDRKNTVTHSKKKRRDDRTAPTKTRSRRQRQKRGKKTKTTKLWQLKKKNVMKNEGKKKKKKSKPMSGQVATTCLVGRIKHGRTWIIAKFLYKPRNVHKRYYKVIFYLPGTRHHAIASRLSADALWYLPPVMSAAINDYVTTLFYAIRPSAIPHSAWLPDTALQSYHSCLQDNGKGFFIHISYTTASRCHAWKTSTVL